MKRLWIVWRQPDIRIKCVCVFLAQLFWFKGYEFYPVFLSILWFEFFRKCSITFCSVSSINSEASLWTFMRIHVHCAPAVHICNCNVSYDAHEYECVRFYNSLRLKEVLRCFWYTVFIWSVEAETYTKRTYDWRRSFIDRPVQKTIAMHDMAYIRNAWVHAATTRPVIVVV